jgi:hypothetical protein
MDLIEFTERYFGVEFTEYQREYIRKLDEKGRDNMAENKTHLIADKSIGGVQREFIEVDRKAEVGDYVWLVNEEAVIEVTEFGVDLANRQIISGDTKALEPTDFVHIDGTRYQLAERKAGEGEKVLIVNAEGSCDMYSNGDVIEAEKVDNFGIYNISVVFADIGSEGGYNSEGYIYNEEYRVLVPADSEPAEPTPDIYSLLANAALKITSLERIVGELVRSKSSIESQLSLTQNNVERLAQELEREKEFNNSIYAKLSDLKDEVESNTKDIAFLDERTFEKHGKPTKSAEEILREISKILERDERQ